MMMTSYAWEQNRQACTRLEELMLVGRDCIDSLGFYASSIWLESRLNIASFSLTGEFPRPSDLVINRAWHRHMPWGEVYEVMRSPRLDLSGFDYETSGDDLLDRDSARGNWVLDGIYWRPVGRKCWIWTRSSVRWLNWIVNCELLNWIDLVKTGCRFFSSSLLLAVLTLLLQGRAEAAVHVHCWMCCSVLNECRAVSFTLQMRIPGWSCQ